MRVGGGLYVRATVPFDKLEMAETAAGLLVLLLYVLVLGRLEYVYAGRAFHALGCIVLGRGTVLDTRTARCNREVGRQ